MEKKRTLPAWMSNSNVKQKDANISNGNKTDLLYEPLQKKMLEALPVFQFKGKIHCYSNLPDASIACAEMLENLELRGELTVGMDLEWDVSYQSRQSKTSVLQLCSSHDECHIFHLTSISDFPKELRRLIENPAVKKVGVGIMNDMWKLERDFHFPVYSILKSSCVDLKDMASDVLQKNGQQWSLDGLVAFLFNHCLQKDPVVRKSKWSQWPLSEIQLEYAALDAYASLVVYEKLLELKKKKDDLIHNAKC